MGMAGRQGGWILLVSGWEGCVPRSNSALTSGPTWALSDLFEAPGPMDDVSIDGFVLVPGSEGAGA